MKLLIVTDNLPPHTSANSNIMLRLADMLSARYGVEVSFLGYQTGEGAMPYRTWAVPTVYRYTQALPEHLPKWEKLCRLALHPTLWPFRAALSCSRYPTWRAYRRLLKQALREEPGFDCVLCAVCPYDTLYAAAKTVKDIPLAVWKLDPWGAHALHLDDRRYWKDEQCADSRCDAIFVTAPIYRDYQTGVNRAPLEKIHQLEFPNLRPPVWDAALAPRFDSGKLNCAYVGQLYPDIRSPKFLFDLFRQWEGTDIVLHVIGNTELQAQQYGPELPSNVILHGIVSPREAEQYMQAADILVNLGNTVPNQLPSKLISYLACGKPILNLCKIPGCLTLPYLEKYPLSLILQEADGLRPETVEQAEAFLRENRGRKLPFEEVAALFPECTPEYVGRQIWEVLRSITETPEKGEV